MAQPLNFWSRFFNGAASFQIDGSFQVVTKNSLDQLDIKLQSDVPSSVSETEDGPGGWKFFFVFLTKIMVMLVRYIPGLIVYCITFFWDLSVNNSNLTDVFFWWNVTWSLKCWLTFEFWQLHMTNGDMTSLMYWFYWSKTWPSESWGSFFLFESSTCPMITNQPLELHDCNRKIHTVIYL